MKNERVWIAVPKGTRRRVERAARLRMLKPGAWLSQALLQHLSSEERVSKGALVKAEREFSFEAR